MTPAQVQKSLQESFNAGFLLISIVTTPGTHGAGMTGIQGWGANTPMAAAVAAATAGFTRDVHKPKGNIFTRGILSMMVAAGIREVFTRFVGRMVSVEGAVPKVHMMVPPIHTWIPIYFGFL